MNNFLKNISYKQAGVTLIVISIIMIIIHSLVILQILPYQWINGGRVNDFNDACKISIFGIVFFIANSILVSIRSNIIPVKVGKTGSIFVKSYLWVCTIFMGITIITQLLGTTFEKFCMSIIAIVSFLAFLRLLKKPTN